jgi:cytochrome oxidase Cu insertion factor (SCO1/SenC/PrrC family)
VIGRALATAAIAALLALDLALPALPIFHRGTEPRVRDDVPGALTGVGQLMPDFTLPDLDGVPVRLADLRGQRVLLTFERSVDW